MHSTQVLLVLSLIGAAAPALSAPIPAGASQEDKRGVGSVLTKILGDAGPIDDIIKHSAIGGAISAVTSFGGKEGLNGIFGRELNERELAELEARAVSFGTLGKELAKGLGSGALLSGILGAIGLATGGDKQARDLVEEHMFKARSEIDARAVSLGVLGKELAKGLGSGALLSGILGAIGLATGGNKQARDLIDEHMFKARSSMDADALEERMYVARASVDARAVSLGTLGKELAKGLGSGALLSGILGAIGLATGGDKQARDVSLEDRAFAADILEPIIGSIIGGLTSKGASTGLGKVFGAPGSKRDFAEGFAASLTQDEADELERQLQSMVDNGQLDPSELSNAGNLSRRQAAQIGKAVVKSTLGDTIKKAIVGGLGSALGGFGIDKLFGSLQNRDFAEGFANSLTQDEADELERHLQSMVDNGELDPAELASAGNLSRRQAAQIGKAVVKSTLGDTIKKAIVGGLGSALGGFGIDKIFGAFQNRDFADDLSTSMTQDQADQLEKELQSMVDSGELDPAMFSAPTNGLARRQAAQIGKVIAKTTLGDTIKKAIVGGLGSALGGFGIDKLFGSLQNRDFTDELSASLTQDQADELEAKLQAMVDAGELDPAQFTKRISLSNLTPLQKGLAGLGVGAAVSGAVGGALNGIKSLFDRDATIDAMLASGEITQEEAEELQHILQAHIDGTDGAVAKRANLGALGKGLVGFITSLGVGTIGSSVLGGIFGQRDLASLSEFDGAMEKRANLGALGKGLAGFITSLGVGTIGSSVLSGIFGERDLASLNDLD